MFRIEDHIGHDRRQVKEFRRKMDICKDTFSDNFATDFAEFAKMHIEGERFVDDLYTFLTRDIGLSVDKNSNKYVEPTETQRDMVRKYSERVFPNNLEYRDGLLQIIDSREIDRKRTYYLIKNLKVFADEPTPPQREALMKYWTHQLYPQYFRRILVSIPNLKNSRKAQSEAIGRCKRAESQLYEERTSDEKFKEAVKAMNKHCGYDTIKIYGEEEVRTWILESDVNWLIATAGYENKCIQKSEEEKKQEQRTEWLNESFNDTEKRSPFLSEAEYESIEAEQESKRIATMEAVNEKRRKQGKEPYNKREYNSYCKAQQAESRTEKGFQLQVIEVRVKKRVNRRERRK